MALYKLPEGIQAENLSLSTHTHSQSSPARRLTYGYTELELDY